MAMLEPPVEYMGLLDGQELTFHIERWVLGETTIYPIRDRGAKVVPTLRLYVRPADKPSGAPYWDVTAGTTITRIRPYLDRPDLRDLEFTFIRRGTPPGGRDEIRISGRPA